MLVLVESPFAGRHVVVASRFAVRDAEENLRYAHALCRHLALDGLAPYASHLFFTQFLDDTIPSERKIGIDAGLEWGAKAERTIVGVDRGISRGMVYGIQAARAAGRPITWYSLDSYANSWLPNGVDRNTWWCHFRDGDLLTPSLVVGHSR